MAELFPLGQELAELIDSLLGSDSDAGSGGGLLDLGAGAGELAMYVAGRGHRVVAIDADPEMVDWAGRRCDERGLDVRWIAGDLVTATRALGERFSVLACVGNTLPHLPDRDQVGAALATMHEVLVPGGHLILQTINVDRCLRLGGLVLPERTARFEGGTLLLRRSYRPEPGGGRLRFETEIEVAGERHDFGLTHLALTAAELETMTEEAGFHQVRLLGGYAGTPWNPEAPATVVLARRG
jgi:SAM-dependent methyltransferase